MKMLRVYAIVSASSVEGGCQVLSGVGHKSSGYFSVALFLWKKKEAVEIEWISGYIILRELF